MVTKILHAHPISIRYRALTNFYMSKPHFRIRTLVQQIIFVSLVVIMFAGAVHASTTAPVLSTTCNTLTAKASSLLTNAGTVLFTCGTVQAVKVNIASFATPVFKLPKGYLSLMLIPHVSNNQKCGIGTILVSGQATKFSTTGNFDYCAVYFSPPGTVLPSFLLSWSQS